MDELLLRNRTRVVEAILYAILKKFPDGVEISGILRDQYLANRQPLQVNVTHNPARDTYIYSLKGEE